MWTGSALKITAAQNYEIKNVSADALKMTARGYNLKKLHLSVS